MTDYLRDFVQESEEQITELNNALLSLENDPDDREAMDRVFRSAHTLKGNSGAMGFDGASDLAHAIENVLEEVRSGNLEVTPELMDRVFEGVDQLEMIIDEVAEYEEPMTDPRDTIDALEAEVEAALAAGDLSHPDDEDIESLLASSSPPTDRSHDVYHVRIQTTEETGGDNAMSVIEALTDAFDLLGTDPDYDRVKDGDYDGTFDAAFASPVGKAAISAALESVDAVDAFIITSATGYVQPSRDTASDEAPSEPAKDVDEMSVDELLEDDDVDQFDDLDSMIAEVEDDVQFDDDLGEAGSFADLDLGDDFAPDIDTVDADADSADVPSDEASTVDSMDVEGAASSDAAADEEPPSADEADEANEATTTDAASPDEPSDEETVEDASETFKELQQEVDPVGFDELQQELEELEFDELDDDEVGFDELLEDDELDDGDFLDDDIGGELGDDIGGELGDMPGNVGDAEDASTETSDTDPGAFGDVDFDAEASTSEDVDTGIGDDTDEFDDFDFGESDTAEADASLDIDDGTTADETAGADTVETDTTETDDFDFGADETSGVETSDFGDIDVDDEADVADAGVADDMEGDFGDMFGEADESDDAAETSASSEADAAPDDADADAAADDALADTVADTDSASASGSTQSSGRSDDVQSLRVDVDQIDTLLNLVESLVTERVRLRRAVERGESLAVIDDELDELEDITAELQDTVMDVRLVPLENVVGRLPRVVRDVAREQDKEVDFELEGTDVEIDRSILSEINDPLIHLVRNAVDHGIEPPSEREDAGKDPTGTVRLDAHRARDRVVIEVSDDGRGLDPDALREEAVEEGIHTRSEVEAMSDEEAYELVFHPGFSTSEEVTDISGRGVGMDVVANTVEEFDGDVSVESTLGEGTTIRLELPISIAISDVLFVESGGEEYGIPIKVIEEVSPPRNVERVDGREVVVREIEPDDPYDDSEPERREYPLIRLSDALETPESGRSGGGMIVRIRDDVRTVALHCDSVRGQQEVVVKPFDGVLSDVDGLSGATVLGEGDVVNILDVETL